MSKIAAVAISGGQDSTMALALMREKGFDVIGLHAYFLPPTEERKAVSDALSKRCTDLGIGYQVIDLSEPFEREVVAPFIADYQQGRTPNPCAICNRSMKFGMLLDAALELGADIMATGHYARIEQHPDHGPLLTRGHDTTKDQSYFLSLVSSANIAKAAFPLGGWLKKDIMPELEKRQLPPPLPSESQEICFIPDDDYKQFLKDRSVRLPGPGKIVLENGKELGRHQGLWRYTLGQRKGLGVSWQEPLYVLEKDLSANTLIVGPKDQLHAHSCTAADMNYMVAPELWPAEILLKTRYRQQAKPAALLAAGQEMRLNLVEPQTRPTPGQIACVHDDAGHVLAGGIITG